MAAIPGAPGRSGSAKRAIPVLLALFLIADGSWVHAADDFKTIGNQAMKDFGSGKYEAAFQGFKKMQRLQPTNFELYIAAGQALQSLGRLEDALTEFQAAIKAQGGKGDRQWEPYHKIGDLLKGAGDLVQALSAYDEALRLSPNQADVLVSRGSIHQHSDNYDQAESDFSRAVKLAPKNPHAWNGLGISWMYQEHAKPDGKPIGFGEFEAYDEASIMALEKVLEFTPESMVTVSNLVMAQNRVCDWSKRNRNAKLLKKALKDSIAKKLNFAPPFHAFEFAYNPKEILLNSKYLSKAVKDRVKQHRSSLPPNSAADAGSIPDVHKTLRVGYVNGAGFHNGTTTSRCLQSMFSFHDRSRFSVLCYALSGDDFSPERKQIKESCDGFVEGRTMTDEQLAHQAAEDAVHILVDTTGYTMRQRTEFIALSNAPIKLSFHGFPGTMAASFIHYLTSDPRTTPPEYQSWYTEKLVLLPNTYLLNDHRQSRREVINADVSGIPTRADLGFKEDDVVLACFNQLYKIEPKVFAVWMKVMAQNKKTKLWLLNFSKAAYKYLRKEAERRKVDGSRLVFHSKFPKHSELLVKAHADLFLDTPLFNAHTTGGDVLWAGIPLVTLPQENFAQRVAAGLVKSVGLERHLIVRNEEDYEQIVLALCRNEKLRNKWRREELVAKRDKLALFDTKLLTGQVEQGMKMMWELYAAGVNASHILVKDHHA